MFLWNNFITFENYRPEKTRFSLVFPNSNDANEDRTIDWECRVTHVINHLVVRNSVTDTTPKRTTCQFLECCQVVGPD